VVRAAKAAKHDLVVVLLHWGKEYADDPGGWRRVLARRLIDAGAHLVIGHHPHVLQGIERHRGGLIAYSLGNFLSKTCTTRRGSAAYCACASNQPGGSRSQGRSDPRIRKTDRGRAKRRASPGCVSIPPTSRRCPSSIRGPQKKAMGVKVRQRMQSLSRTLKTTLVRKNEALVWQRGKRRCW
jgi:hypothetical protein